MKNIQSFGKKTFSSKNNDSFLTTISCLLQLIWRSVFQNIVGILEWLCSIYTTSTLKTIPLINWCFLTVPFHQFCAYLWNVKFQDQFSIPINDHLLEFHFPIVFAKTHFLLPMNTFLYSKKEEISEVSFCTIREQVNKLLEYRNRQDF